MPVDQRQPGVRALEEGHRWHQHAATAQDEGREEQPDQPEVVVERQPAAHRAVGAHPGDRREDLGVGQQVGVVDHGALGGGGGPRGVLEESQRVRVGRWWPPPARRGQLVRRVGCEHGHAAEFLFLGPGRERFQVRSLRQGTDRSRVPGDRGEPVGPLPLRAVGRRCGHRDHARVHAAQQGPHEPGPGGCSTSRRSPTANRSCSSAATCRAARSSSPYVRVSSASARSGSALKIRAVRSPCSSALARRSSTKVLCWSMRCQPPSAGWSRRRDVGRPSVTQGRLPLLPACERDPCDGRDGWGWPLPHPKGHSGAAG